ncbi:hypothetical protein EG68_09104 [Paragonimus skrjabini miyazakii]|uniref:Uncharacterized protein n=1 Tax=Paragonimus skrjabini miyazakii TaxID=59628 RepID=A0A8S9YNR6_9TREM|nr:hypothetical protein EG68_09104 [Paragonimus skrjabini miyazakii]
MAKKPPRPRQSQSPALRTRISIARPEVPVRDTPYETDQIPSDSLVQSEFIESSKANWTENFDNYQDLFYTTNMTDVEEGLHKLDDDKVNVSEWIKETSKAESMSTHPFLIPTSSHLQSDTAWRTHKPSLTSFDPSLDILAQWRLRRKMEAAQWAVPVTHPATLSDKVSLTAAERFCATFQGQTGIVPVDPGLPPLMNQQDKAPTTEAFTQCDQDHLCISFPVYTQTDDKNLLCDRTVVCDVAVTTDDLSSVLTSRKPGQRSVRIMAVPCRRDVNVQTPCYSSCSALVDEVHSSEQPILVNHNSPHRTLTKVTLSTPVPPLLAVVSQQKPELENTFLFPTSSDVTKDVDQFTDTDSWQWPPSPSPSSVSKVDTPGPECLSRNYGPKLTDRFLFTDRTAEIVESVTNKGDTQKVSQCDSTVHAAKAFKTSEAESVNTPAVGLSISSSLADIANLHIDACIARYVRHSTESVPLDAHSSEDPITKELCWRRSKCLMKLNQVIELLHSHLANVLETCGWQITLLSFWERVHRTGLRCRWISHEAIPNCQFPSTVDHPAAQT